MGSNGEETEAEGNSMINQTVAMVIAGTSTSSPMSRPSSFLLNSQVRERIMSAMSNLEREGRVHVTSDCSPIVHVLLLVLLCRRVASTEASRPSQVGACSSVCCGC